MRTLKLIQKLSKATVVAAFMALLNPELGQTATVVTPEINRANVNDPAAVDACPRFVCEPGEVFLGNNAGPTPTSTIINNTDYTITGITFEFPKYEDAVWNKGMSDIFSEIKISEDGRAVSFSGGTFPVGQAAILIAKSGNETVDILGQFSGEPAPVPEPSSALGLLVLGALGAGATLKKKLTSSTLRKKLTS